MWHDAWTWTPKGQTILKLHDKCPVKIVMLNFLHIKPAISSEFICQKCFELHHEIGCWLCFRLRKCTKRLMLEFVRIQSMKRRCPKKSRRRGEKCWFVQSIQFASYAFGHQEWTKRRLPMLIVLFLVWPRWNRAKLSLAQRKDRVAQKKASFLRAQEKEDAEWGVGLLRSSRGNLF